VTFPKQKVTDVQKRQENFSKNFPVRQSGPNFFQTFEKLPTARNFFKKRHKVISHSDSPISEPLQRRTPTRRRSSDGNVILVTHTVAA
jgi:hypothetical protein